MLDLVFIILGGRRIMRKKVYARGCAGI